MQAARQLTAATQAGLFLARCTSASLQNVAVRHFAAPGAEGRQKGNNAAAAASAGGFVRTEAGLNELYMRSVEPKPHAVPPLAPEVAARAKGQAVTYTKLMWKRHHVRNRDLQRKLMLKWAAISALPSVEMKKEALVIDPFVPMWSRVPAATPPVKGFHGETTAAEAAAPEGDAASKTATGAKKDDKKKSVAQTSLAAAVRRGRGREEDDDSSLFGIATDEKTALHAPEAPVSATPAPVAAAPAAKGKGKKK